MNLPSVRNHGFTYIVILIVCGLFDYITAGTLHFIILAHLRDISHVVYFEDLIFDIILFALIACVLAYFFASQVAVYRSILITTLVSTFGLVLNIGGLLFSLVNRLVDPTYLLIAAVIVYASNVLVFSVWYWLLDYASQCARNQGASFVPVLIFPHNASKLPGYDDWRPGFIDYLYLSFLISSSIGPSDTIVISRRAKLTVMCQVTISLIVLIVLAARAIGIIQ